MLGVVWDRTNDVDMCFSYTMYMYIHIFAKLCMEAAHYLIVTNINTDNI